MLDLFFLQETHSDNFMEIEWSGVSAGHSNVFLTMEQISAKGSVFYFWPTLDIQLFGKYRTY